MKKLRKIGKIAIPAMGVVAAGAGAVKTYGDFNKTNATLMLQNIEAMTAPDEFASAPLKTPSGTKIGYVDFFTCVNRNQLASFENTANINDDFYSYNPVTTLNANLCPSGGVVWRNNSSNDNLANMYNSNRIPACDGTGDVVPDSKGSFDVGVCYRTRSN